MADATKIVSINFSVEQVRETYQALKPVPDTCRKEAIKIFVEHGAVWTYQLPDDARFKVQQLEDRETWAIQAMGILAAAAAVEGFPTSP